MCLLQWRIGGMGKVGMVLVIGFCRVRLQLLLGCGGVDE